MPKAIVSIPDRVLGILRLAIDIEGFQARFCVSIPDRVLGILRLGFPRIQVRLGRCFNP